MEEKGDQKGQSPEYKSINGRDFVIEAKPGLIINLHEMQNLPHNLIKDGDDLLIEYLDHTVIVKGYYDTSILDSENPVLLKHYDAIVYPESYKAFHPSLPSGPIEAREHGDFGELLSKALAFDSDISEDSSQDNVISDVFIPPDKEGEPPPVLPLGIDDRNSRDGQNDVLDTSSGFSSESPLTYSLAPGSNPLPEGLSLNTSTGLISGTIDNSASQVMQSEGGQKGIYEMTVVATSTDGSSAENTFTWTVINPPPEAKDDMASANEGDGIINGTVTSNDSDPDNDTPLTFSLNVPAPPGFTFYWNGNYRLDTNNPAYELDAGDIETLTLPYTVDDGEGGLATATLTITVVGTNDVPMVTAIDDQADQDSDSVSVDVSGYFTDADPGNVFTYGATGLPTGLSIHAGTGVISGTIDNSASQLNGGVYSVTVTATDSEGVPVSDTFTWTITNPPPEAKDDMASANEGDGIINGTVASNDSDPDNDTPLTFSLNVSAPPGFTFNSDGTYSLDTNNPAYELDAGDIETLTLPYTVDDGEGGLATATLTITVVGTNDVPMVTAIDDQADQDSDSVSVDVSGYFTDADPGNVFSYSATGLPTGLSIHAGTGVISGTIDNSASQLNGGVYSVTVMATDSEGVPVSDTFTWTITNPPPEAKDDSTSANEGDGIINGTVASNDSDPDNDTPLTFSLNVSAPPGFTFNSDGTYSLDTNNPAYELDAGDIETLTLPYTVDDGEGGLATATLTITVVGTNDVPMVTAIDDQADQDSDSVSVDVSGYFTDADPGNVFSYSATGLPTGLSIHAGTGVISGTIDNSASQLNGGVYSVTVTATDSEGVPVSDTFTWTITNPPPEAKDDMASANEGDGVINGTVASNDSDPDNDTPLTFSLNNPAPAGLIFNSDGSYSLDTSLYNVPSGDTLTLSIPYTVDDQEGGTDTAILTIDIVGNLAPTAENDAISTLEDTPLSVAASPTTGLLANDSDPESNPISITAIDGNPAQVGVPFSIGFATVTINANGSYDVVPVTDDHGFTQVDYTLTDSFGNNSTATVDIRVDAVADQPSLTDGEFLTPGMAYTVADTKGGPRETSLFKIDLSTGAATEVGPLIPGESKIEIEGMTYNTDDGFLYAFADEKDISDFDDDDENSGDKIIKIDPTTGNIVSILEVTQDPVETLDHSNRMGMAYFNGDAYIATRAGGSNSDVFKVNLTTGVATYLGDLNPIGFSGTTLFGLTYNPDTGDFVGLVRNGGDINMVNITGLLDNNLNNNNATIINDASTGQPIELSNNTEGIAYNGAGFFVTLASRGTAETKLVNPDTGEIIELDPLPVNLFRGDGPESLAIMPGAGDAVTEGQDFFYSFSADFNDIADGSEEQAVFIKVPNADWVADPGLTVIDTAVDSNPYPAVLPAGVYIVVDMTDMDAATGELFESVLLNVPTGTTLTEVTLTTYAIAEEVNIVAGDNTANNIASISTSSTATIQNIVPPIVLDLDGDGIEYNTQGVLFDTDSDGVKEKTAWVGEDDALLAYDKNADNRITDTDEIAFASYLEGAETDLEGLAAFDTNNDNQLTADDAEWSKFKVWQDKNQDGISDQGELIGLGEAGIVGVDLRSDNNDSNPATGVYEYGQGVYYKVGGGQGVFADVAFSYEEVVALLKDDELDHAISLLDDEDSESEATTALPNNDETQHNKDFVIAGEAEISYGSLSGEADIINTLIETVSSDTDI